MQWVDISRQAVDLLGVFGNAILGGLAARAAGLDVVGFIVLAILSGLGGGMIRDVLLQQGPVVALTDPYYLATAVVGAMIAYLLNFTGKAMRRSLVLLDSLALGCWAAVGAQKGLEAGLPWLAGILLGVTTAVGGGMVRDLLLLKRPAVLGGNTLYATSAFVASVLMVLAHELHQVSLGYLAAIVVGAALSLLARRYRWSLPTQARPLSLEQLRLWRVFNPTWRRPRGRTARARDRSRAAHPSAAGDPRPGSPPADPSTPAVTAREHEPRDPEAHDPRPHDPRPHDTDLMNITQQNDRDGWHSHSDRASSAPGGNAAAGERPLTGEDERPGAST